MITLHILKLLSDNGFGTIDVDMFFEEIPISTKGIAKQGLWIVTRGAPLDRFNVATQNFDIYTRYTDKLAGYKKLEDVLRYLQEAYGDVCELPTVPPYSTEQYNNVRITPTSGVESVGNDENNMVVRVISGSVQYGRNQ